MRICPRLTKSNRRIRLSASFLDLARFDNVTQKAYNPLSMGTKENHIVFNGPSAQSTALFNAVLEYRKGATPWEVPSVDLSQVTTEIGKECTIANATFPKDHPFSALEIVFHPYEYENSPYS